MMKKNIKNKRTDSIIESRDYLTDYGFAWGAYGFVWGAKEISRTAVFPSERRVICISTPYEARYIRVTPKG